MSLQFASPLFLYGLIALAIPVIIHLFNFRKYKIVYFSNTNLLQNITQQTKSKNKLKHLLVLLARLCAIACLVLAFSQPYIPVSNNSSFTSTRSLTALYIDNSFSMSAEGSRGQLLEEAKKRAVIIINNYPRGTSFIIATNDENPESFFLMSREQALEFIKTINISSSTASLGKASRIINTTAQSESPGSPVTLYVISDFQKTNADFQSLTSFNNTRFFFLIISARVTANISIDSCWFLSPTHALVQPEKISISIQNNSDENYRDIPVTFSINDTVKAISSVSLTPQEKKTITLDYSNTSPGFKNCKVEINDYPVVYDNSYYVTYDVTSIFNVLIVSQKEPNKYLEAILDNNSSISLTKENLSNINYSLLGTNNMVVLDNLQELSSGLINELSLFAREGGCVFISPAPDASISSYNQFLLPLGISLGSIERGNIKTGKLNINHTLFHEVFKDQVANADLPLVGSRFKISTGQHSPAQGVMWTETNEQIVVTAPMGKGSIVLVGTPCSNDNVSLVKHPVFLPLLINSVFMSRQASAFNCTTREDNTVKIKQKTSNEKMLKIVNAPGTYAEIPSQSSVPSESATRLLVGQNIHDAGVYYIVDDKTRLINLAFNYSRRESIMQFFSKDDIEQTIQQTGIHAAIIDKPTELTGDIIKQQDRGIQLWKWCIALVLAFLMLETLLIRLWKPSSR